MSTKYRLQEPILVTGETGFIGKVMVRKLLGMVNLGTRTKLGASQKLRKMHLHLNGKNIFITGGSSGIGLATAKQLSHIGAHIAIFARNVEKLSLAKAEIEKNKKNNAQQVQCFEIDVADNEKVVSSMDQAVKKFGAPDILVVNAGVGYGDYFENIPYDVFDRVMKINVYGARNTIAALLPAMKQKGGKIIIISSIAGLTGMFGYTAYGTSKFALTGFTECLRPELKKHNIDVSIVCPPEVETPFIAKEAKHLPPEARAVKNMAGLITTDKAADAIISAMVNKRFMTIPGFKANLTYYLTRFLPKKITQTATDLNANWHSNRKDSI